KRDIIRCSVQFQSQPPKRVVTKLPVIKQNTTSTPTPSKSAVKGDQSKRVISIFAMGEVNWVTTPYTHLNTTAKMASGNNTTKPPTNDFFTKRVGLSPSCAISDTPQLLHTQLQLFQTLARH